MQYTSEGGGHYKLLLWSSSYVVHTFEYSAYHILFPLHKGGGQGRKEGVFI